MGEKRNAYRILVGKARREDQDGDGRIPVEGSCEHDNEPSSSIKCCEVLEWLHNWRLLKKGSDT
jgi:hypothetical protein